MSVLAVVELRERLMSRPKERAELIALFGLALSVRVAVCERLMRLIQEPEIDAKVALRSEVSELESQFEKKKEEFLENLSAVGIKAGEFTYGDMCNSLLP
jgi:hypothetical protein